MKQQVFFVGTEAEVDHHAKPLEQLLDYALVEPDDLARRAMPGDLAIFFSEHFDRFREAVQAAKQNQIATLSTWSMAFLSGGTPGRIARTNLLVPLPCVRC